MIHGHSANSKIVLYMASVVVGQVDHQVYVALSDQSRNTRDRKVEENSVWSQNFSTSCNDFEAEHLF